jgi:hypothetical protein
MEILDIDNDAFKIFCAEIVVEKNALMPFFLTKSFS